MINYKSVVIGLFAAVLFFILFGIMTVLIPNSFFARMTPIHFYDYIFLTLTSILLGISVALWHHQRSLKTSCASAMAGGSVGSVFAFGCAICNKLLVAILGVAGVMTYFMPIQPYLGLASVSLLGFAVYRQTQQMKLLTAARTTAQEVRS